MVFSATGADRLMVGCGVCSDERHKDHDLKKMFNRKLEEQKDSKTENHHRRQQNCDSIMFLDFYKMQKGG